MTALLDPSPVDGLRLCAWCKTSIPARARRDALTCSRSCRQARNRFTRSVGRGVVGGHPLRLAYADPPYPGLSAKYYGGHPDFAGEVDHPALISRLCSYDGWALSTSASALPLVLASCPPGVRVAAWFRGERPTRSYGPLNAWEPVIFWGGRAVVSTGGRDASLSAAEGDASGIPARRLDALIHFARPRTTDPNRVIGAKPAAFARWMFDLLGAGPQDTLDDLFPGSGGIARAWETFAIATRRVAPVLHDGSGGSQ